MLCIGQYTKIKNSDCLLQPACLKLTTDFLPPLYVYCSLHSWGESLTKLTISKIAVDYSYYCCHFTTAGTARRNSNTGESNHTYYWRGDDPDWTELRWYRDGCVWPRWRGPGVSGDIYWSEWGGSHYSYQDLQSCLPRGKCVRRPKRLTSTTTFQRSTICKHVLM